jgi:hypothetical protein
MDPQLMLLVSVFVVVTAVFGGLWLARVRAARRFRAVVDAYAEQEIAQEARWRIRRTSTQEPGKNWQ